MAFNPQNPIIQLCVQGMDKEEKGNPQEAGKIFLQAWNESTNDFEKFTAAYFVARHQKEVADKLKWLKTTLEIGLKINDINVQSAFPALHSNIAKCYDNLGNSDLAKKHHELSVQFKNTPADEGPFYHGTRADLQVGDLLTSGGKSNYKSDLKMNHIYFTALVNGAGFAAALAQGEGDERVYIVEPTGNFENDPNVTDKKFPGNPTRSYRSAEPLKIIGEVREWTRISPEELWKWREKLANNKGDIIN